jgi:lysophospholipase L1-like esterase
VVLALAVILAGLGTRPAWAAPQLPDTMAAVGDSITRAYDVCCYYGDHPGQSWSTGYTSYDGISSHYERAQAVNQHARYVTILLGANDLCTSSPDTMTPTTTFQAEFQQAMVTLMQQNPRPYVFVSSIPNIYQLWRVLHTNWLARWVWSNFHICQSMLGAARTEEQRQQVVAREQAFNQILAAGCSAYARCRWDNLAVYDFQFSATQVSTLDYFHPSLSGQASLASVTWAASWWPSV